MELARPDVRRAKFVQRPRTGNREVAGAKCKIPRFDAQGHRSGFEETDFHPFVPMEVQPPILSADAVPEAETADARKLRRFQEKPG